MNVEIKYGNKIETFENKASIVVGNTPDCDFVLDGANGEISFKLLYHQKYGNYVLVNSNNDTDLLYNNGTFKKILVPAHFSISHKGMKETVLIVISLDTSKDLSVRSSAEAQPVAQAIPATAVVAQSAPQAQQTIRDKKDIFNGPVEHNRIAIVKEIGYKIQALKTTISTMSHISFILNIATFILSVVCSFGMTNFLLGLKVDTSKSVLNLTTNFGFLIAISIIVFAVSFIMNQSVYSLLEANQSKRYNDSNKAQLLMVYIASAFMLVIYAINLFYYKDIPGMYAASFFIALLFVGALATVAVAGGYFRFQLKNYNYQLTNCEYREDFETVLKGYRSIISSYVNSLSEKRLEMIRAGLLNLQMKQIVEVGLGLITSPFLAYGVSNTLASCDPEAAGWIRISGLRFSPIFLVLATFMIVFAFFSFVRAFSIGKQIKNSEIIKFDGFHDYSNHGVNILGLDAIRSLNKEKNVVMSIACSIILIEFTMNISYFIQEIGGDIGGIIKSTFAALVPTAILIAETQMLSGTIHKINNYNEVLSTLD